MTTRYSAKVGDVVVLEAKFELDGAPYDVFEIDKVELLDADLEVSEEKDGAEVTKIDTGHYSISFGPLLTGGEFSDHWSYIAVEGGEVETLVLSLVVAEVAGVEGEDEPSITPDPPDIGTANVCEITHRFFDASGNAVPGIYIRFRPNVMPAEVPTVGTAARDADTTSDENGNISLYLIRGVTGMMAISGVGLVREVTIPDVAQIDIMDLMATAPDLLEVQEPEYFDYIRRS